MRQNIYFSDEETEYIRSQEKGFVRKLIQQHMGNQVVSPFTVSPSNKEKVAPKKISEDVMEKLKSMGVTTGKEIRFADNICKECNHVKVAGRCINKECKRKGKL